ncbi:30S ribosomal protein S6 [Candidatus Roizmanbacteria bacterium RIFCSPLOWO2_01_FULL_40_13]|nr:MAG: 30S ribosomal protein S6 [Candidatus Roizmanbacteria bacterium RIFCSPLOWO2_01_FULL_40_13]
MKYDLTLMLNEEDESKIIKELLSSLKIKVEKEDFWGKKTLAYPIDKFKALYYFNWQIDSAEDIIKELKNKIKFEEKLIRYLLLKA